METRRRRQVGDAQPPANNDEMVENEEEELIPAVMGPDDHRRMKLTSEELGWAQEIRDAIAAIVHEAEQQGSGLRTLVNEILLHPLFRKP